MIAALPWAAVACAFGAAGVASATVFLHARGSDPSTALLASGAAIAGLSCAWIWWRERGRRRVIAARVKTSALRVGALGFAAMMVLFLGRGYRLRDDVQRTRIAFGLAEAPARRPAVIAGGQPVPIDEPESSLLERSTAQWRKAAVVARAAGPWRIGDAVVLRDVVVRRTMTLEVDARVERLAGAAQTEWLHVEAICRDGARRPASIAFDTVSDTNVFGRVDLEFFENRMQHAALPCELDVRSQLEGPSVAKACVDEGGITWEPCPAVPRLTSATEAYAPGVEYHEDDRSLEVQYFVRVADGMSDEIMLEERAACREGDEVVVAWASHTEALPTDRDPFQYFTVIGDRRLAQRPSRCSVEVRYRFDHRDPWLPLTTFCDARGTVTEGRCEGLVDEAMIPDEPQWEVIDFDFHVVDDRLEYLYIPMRFVPDRRRALKIDARCQLGSHRWQSTIDVHRDFGDVQPGETARLIGRVWLGSDHAYPAPQWCELSLVEEQGEEAVTLRTTCFDGRELRDGACSP